MEEAIKLAIEKGGYDRMFEGTHATSEAVLLDPEFWKSLGKALGNKEEMRCSSLDCDDKLCEYAGYKDPWQMLLNFMEHLWQGKSTDEFFKELLTPPTREEKEV